MRSRTALAVVTFGVALVLPSLRAGFFADDYLQIAQLEGWSANPVSPLDLYSFVPRDRARVAALVNLGAPYFIAPTLELRFLRPLSSALMALDHALWGRRPFPYHVHTLLWYAALLAVVGALYRRAAPRSLALLAFLIFCLDDGHALSVTFIAARNAVVSCVLVWLGLGAHLRWRIHGWRAGAWPGAAARRAGPRSRGDGPRRARLPRRLGDLRAPARLAARAGADRAPRGRVLRRLPPAAAAAPMPRVPTSIRSATRSASSPSCRPAWRCCSAT